MLRKIIKIDEEKCNGCGLCAKACHEGAIEMVDGKAKLTREVKAQTEGYISAMNTEEIGMTSLVLGGGRETKESEIDLTVGMVFHKKIGDKVMPADTIAVLHANDEEKLKAAITRLQAAITVKPEPCKPLTHILGVVE